MIGNIILLVLSVMVYIIEWNDIRNLNTIDATISGSIRAILALIFGCLGISISIYNLIL